MSTFRYILQKKTTQGHTFITLGETTNVVSFIHILWDSACSILGLYSMTNMNLKVYVMN